MRGCGGIELDHLHPLGIELFELLHESLLVSARAVERGRIGADQRIALDGEGRAQFGDGPMQVLHHRGQRGPEFVVQQLAHGGVCYGLPAIWASSEIILSAIADGLTL